MHMYSWCAALKGLKRVLEHFARFRSRASGLSATPPELASCTKGPRRAETFRGDAPNFKAMHEGDRKECYPLSISVWISVRIYMCICTHSIHILVYVYAYVQMYI